LLELLKPNLNTKSQKQEKKRYNLLSQNNFSS
jgi:hypothetical protein